MADYHDLYLNGGVLLLHFIIETFREESINSFQSDPDHYLSTLGYSCVPRLWLTDVNLKLISYVEKKQFVENTISGCIFMVCKGYAEAKKKFLKY